MIEASAKATLYRPLAQGHFVQFYAGAEQRLSENIAVFLGQGLNDGEAALMVSTLERWLELERATVDELDFSSAVREGRALFIDAARLVDCVCVDGELRYEVFEREVGGAIGRLQGESGTRRVRVYGDAVGLLWSAGRKDEAEVLELYWARLMRSMPFSLLCGYPVDVYSEEFHMQNVDAVLCRHTHLLPSCDEFRVENALRQAMNQVLGARAEGLRKLMKANYRPSWGTLPRVEAAILWVRNNLPDLADTILEKTLANLA